ncbi:MAG: hypothetical protein V3V10_06735 [Planctomycetota bacterium]
MPKDLEQATKDLRALLQKRADFVSLVSLADGYRIKLKDSDSATENSVKKDLKAQGMTASKIDKTILGFLATHCGNCNCI